MKIKISNQKELKRFYNLIPFYKSIIFHFTTFTLEKDKYNLKPIIETLNMKKRKKRITYIYDTTCNQLDLFYEGKNICEFENNQCMTQKKYKDKFNGCCRICQYSSCNGCPTKNLTCKLFYCESVKQKYKTLSINDLPILKCFSIRQRVIIKADYFSSREDVIWDLYIGSLFIAAIRIYYRLIKLFINKKKFKSTLKMK